MSISIDQITDTIFLGSTPYNLDDINLLVEHFGIDSVISLQSDIDLLQRNISIEQFERHYKDRGVEFSRFSIEDFNVDELAKKLYEPTQELSRQVALDKKVFVHCNAGICRASSTVLAYLCAYRDYGIDDGIAFIRQQRPIINPAKKAVVKTLERLKETN